ncbi:hypothetical protein ACTNA4_07645 [Bariatricus sp. HCP28S3_A7]|uniref:hypothetical protein n=1 Tax=Bariatricus sp. HCP28S3_A7 TaxID=3438894 RepID=UPI003F8C803E
MSMYVFLLQYPIRNWLDYFTIRYILKDYLDTLLIRGTKAVLILIVFCGSSCDEKGL